MCVGVRVCASPAAATNDLRRVYIRRYGGGVLCIAAAAAAAARMSEFVSSRPLPRRRLVSFVLLCAEKLILLRLVFSSCISYYTGRLARHVPVYNVLYARVVTIYTYLSSVLLELASTRALRVLGFEQYI